MVLQHASCSFRSTLKREQMVLFLFTSERIAKAAELSTLRSSTAWTAAFTVACTIQIMASPQLREVSP